MTTTQERRMRGAHRAPRPDARPSLAGGVGELLITLGVVMLLFCVYQLYYTNVAASREMARGSQELQERWRTRGGGTQVAAADTGTGTPRFDPGEGFAFLYLPRLGDTYRKLVLEGTARRDLSRGLGHYTSTVMPGQVGNFAVAGHRASHGEPFANLPNLRLGDPIVVETETSWYVYVVDRFKQTTPSDAAVLLPVPERAGAAPTKKVITLTTCTPRFGSTGRYIVFGHLRNDVRKSEGRPPAEVPAAALASG